MTSQVAYDKLKEMLADIKSESESQTDRKTDHPYFAIKQTDWSGAEHMVQTFFTRKSAEQYLHENRENLRKDAYVIELSGAENPELSAVIELLEDLARNPDRLDLVA